MPYMYALYVCLIRVDMSMCLCMCTAWRRVHAQSVKSQQKMMAEDAAHKALEARVCWRVERAKP